MILGGAGSPKTAELFDWRTYQQYQLPDLPVGVYGHTAISMNGDIAYCEGGKARKSCYKMDQATKKWVQVSCLNLTL